MHKDYTNIHQVEIIYQQIYFPIGGEITKIIAGEALNEYDVKKPPELAWPTEEKTYYTLCMIGTET